MEPLARHRQSRISTGSRPGGRGERDGWRCENVRLRSCSSNAALRKRSLRARPMPSSGKGSTMMRSGSVCSGESEDVEQAVRGFSHAALRRKHQDRSGSGPVENKRCVPISRRGYLPDRSRGSPICKGSVARVMPTPACRVLPAGGVGRCWQLPSTVMDGAHSTDTLLDRIPTVLRRDEAVRLGFEKRKDGGFGPMAIRAAVEDVVDAIAEAFQHARPARVGLMYPLGFTPVLRGNRVAATIQRKRVCGGSAR